MTRLNLRAPHSAERGHRYYDVSVRGKRVCGLVRGWPQEGGAWRVVGLGRLSNHGRFTRRGDALRGIRRALEART